MWSHSLPPQARRPRPPFQQIALLGGRTALEFNLCSGNRNTCYLKQCLLAPEINELLRGQWQDLGHFVFREPVISIR
jgi:hypothetical protein